MDKKYTFYTDNETIEAFAKKMNEFDALEALFAGDTAKVTAKLLLNATKLNEAVRIITKNDKIELEIKEVLGVLSSYFPCFLE